VGCSEYFHVLEFEPPDPLLLPDGSHKWHYWDDPKKELPMPISIWTKHCRPRVFCLKFPTTHLGFLQFLTVFKNYPVTLCIFHMPSCININVYWHIPMRLFQRCHGLQKLVNCLLHLVISSTLFTVYVMR
jgi:hypothetical protein